MHGTEAVEKKDPIPLAEAEGLFSHFFLNQCFAFSPLEYIGISCLLVCILKTKQVLVKGGRATSGCG